MLVLLCTILLYAYFSRWTNKVFVQHSSFFADLQRGVKSRDDSSDIPLDPVVCLRMIGGLSSVWDRDIRWWNWNICSKIVIHDQSTSTQICQMDSFSGLRIRLLYAQISSWKLEWRVSTWNTDLIIYRDILRFLCHLWIGSNICKVIN